MYIIQREQDYDVAGVWYFKGLGKPVSDTRIVLWTEDFDSAYTFEEEEEAKDLYYDFLMGRQIEIIEV